MTANIEEMLSAILADLDGIQNKLEKVATAVDGATDTVEASRISLTALRDVVRNSS